ncbi:xanthine permease XanP [Zobellella denitrificans]|jgi:xanthine permease XanP|uniref:Xanthine permease XanP n=1 Tax=Zobellella denitrificans TaxID=347534 RepID=A0A231MV32_9GAMM|nr:nucleobase:cation symporter-2 family protein [Zobellella denitrificans]ATG75286.1 xanthine permease XanP [Zobellella denitrificans]OXS14073.1 xanthine permease XanP [Zobellella denitrificans]
MTQETRTEQSRNHDLLYSLHDRPSFWPSTFAALQHVLASLVGVITPTLIVGGVLGLGEHVPYLISMALMVSGVGTFIQCRRIGPVGAGMLCLQGTSFAFLTAVLSAGMIVKSRGGTPEDILATIFGVSFCAAFIEIFLSRFVHKLQKIITPVVTGTIIILIGIPLIKVAMTDIGGGFGAQNFGALDNLLLAGIVLVSVILLNRSKNPMIRLAAVVIGLALGMLAAFFMGRLDFSHLSSLPVISIPVPFKFGFQFDLAAFIPLAILFCVSAMETTGDLTANSTISREPVKGPVYINRIRGGVLADGVNSMIAAVFNSMPSTTFSQNNGVIALTGVASRFVGIYIAAILFIMGLFPVIGGILQQMPKPVLGGATLIMFGTVAVAGIRVLSQANLDRRNMMIIAISVGMGIGVSTVPDVLQALPKTVANILSSPVAMGAITAILLSLVLPESKEEEVDVAETEADAAAKKKLGEVS